MTRTMGSPHARRMPRKKSFFDLAASLLAGLLLAPYPSFAGDRAADINSKIAVDPAVGDSMKPLIAKLPESSQLAPDPNPAQNPPPAKDVRLFSLDKPLADGSNAAVFVEYVELRGGNITLAPNGKAVVLNDSGVLPDSRPGDGVFSAFVHIDLAAHQEDLKNFQQRLAQLNKAPRIGIFSGRELTKTMDFMPDPGSPDIIQLPGDITLRPITVFDFPLPATADAGRTLAITDLSVVADPLRTYDQCDLDGDGRLGNPNGAWTFKTLMTQMANTPVTGITAQQFVHRWIQSFTVSDGPNERLNTILPRRASGPTYDHFLRHLRGWDPNNPNTLDLDSVPFRLLAIINRIDLAQSTVYGPGSPGELRFVFGVVRPGAPCRPDLMTVILEYGLPTSTCDEVKNLAQAWINLDFRRPAFPSSSYNAALQALTDPVTAANAVPAKPNGSAINQVRTNEQIFDSDPWELREFRLREGALAACRT